MRSKLATVLVVLGGLLMLLSAYAHAFQGWPAMAEGLAPHPVDAEIRAALAIGWLWGSACMAGLGVLTLGSLPGLRRGERSARIAIAAAGLTWLLFGAGALWWRWPRTHFLAFVVLGAIVLAGLVLDPRRADSPAR
jgi:hypothetical protein